MEPNPLSPARKPQAARPQHPAQAHAQIWQHVSNIHPSELQEHADRTATILPILGALSSDPKVTRKDVIKAAADAAGSGNVDPSQAVQFISQMPDDPNKLQPWLKNLYAANLSAMVHMHAAMQTPQAEPQQ